MQTFFLAVPRIFRPRPDKDIEIRDCGRINLEPDEQVTFVGENSVEIDFCRKDWGFYPAPSLNSRMPRFNLRAVLVRNTKGQFFVLAVEESKGEEFERYVRDEELTVIGRFDDPDFIARLESIGK